MQAVVKTPHTEIRVNGLIPPKLLALLKAEYGSKLKISDDETAGDVFATDWYKSTKAGMTPGLVMRHYRQMGGMTQAQLAEKLSIPRQHVSNMERGQRPISLATARRLAALFDVPTGRFVE